jgi:hypothetical protein
LLGRGITKCHLCGEKNCRKIGKTFVENRYRDKTIEIRNSNPQG